EQIAEKRPYMDTESGPIYSFMTLKRKLSESFEQEYYHNMSWAHLATGGVGSGMRWPFRTPHCLSAGMHDVQQGLSRFVNSGAIDWTIYSPVPVGHLLKVLREGGEHAAEILPFGCGDGNQALVWLLRDPYSGSVETEPLTLILPDLQPGEYSDEFWESYSGTKVADYSFSVVAHRQHGGPRLSAEVMQAENAYTSLSIPYFEKDIVLAIRSTQLGKARGNCQEK
ncbi:MAG: hypothetical protein M3014_03995, partial [Chloroflexota bacterium]|nr:hypothetical protein [Chloroflexota bacterium]